ncbi:MAG: hypothetical protein U0271_22290 [Polyangiaceae bacterium]
MACRDDSPNAGGGGSGAGGAGGSGGVDPVCGQSIQTAAECTQERVGKYCHYPYGAQGCEEYYECQASNAGGSAQGGAGGNAQGGAGGNAQGGAGGAAVVYSWVLTDEYCQ